MLECLDYIEKINNYLNNQDIPTVDFFNEKEELELLENILGKIDYYVKSNLLEMREPLFCDTMKEEVLSIVFLELENINNEGTYEYINEIFEDAMQYYFNYIGINRCHGETFVEGKCDIENIKKKLDDIRNRPQPEQRTEAWYRFRYNLITASNAWKAFDSESIMNSLIYEKCCPLNTDKYGTVNMDSPFHWGHKYEPISVEVYEEKYKTKIEDFGCVPDKKYNFLGASPDGINVDDKSPRYGRMLEIKNIVNREINGIPKKEYWVQMQMQMNVCDLDECDFLETKFIEYDNYKDFKEDGDFYKSKDDKKKGMMICFIKDNIPIYEYCPFNLTDKQIEKWENKTLAKYENDEWFKNIYWKLETYSCVLVKRNSEWFNSAIPKLQRCWEIIEYERTNGYDHRKPKRRTIQPINKEKKCLIKINTI